MRILFACLCLCFVSLQGIYGQRLSFGDASTGDVSSFYAETKQVNQFLRRFNCEESPRGDRYYERDSLFRNNAVRRKYITELFDNSNTAISTSLKASFIAEVTYERRPSFLDFHGGNWFAQIDCRFLYRGVEETATLFMRLEEEKVGSKWVFQHVSFAPYQGKNIPRVTMPYISSYDQKFMHPMSHELDFMNLQKTFADSRNVFQYVARDGGTDAMRYFLSEVRQGSLKFETVDDVRFHFFQIDGWYFEVSKFNRSGYNRGWLISQLTRATESQKTLLEKYILRLM